MVEGVEGEHPPGSFVLLRKLQQTHSNVRRLQRDALPSGHAG